MRYLFLLVLTSCSFSSVDQRSYIKFKLKSGDVVQCRRFIKDECGLYMYACGDDMNSYLCQKDYKIISWRIVK